MVQVGYGVSSMVMLIAVKPLFRLMDPNIPKIPSAIGNGQLGAWTIHC
jgi:hypothetical protein